eukprot:scaffold185771_cov24-Prasinocladus_malaysianus.AAC.1
MRATVRVAPYGSRRQTHNSYESLVRVPGTSLRGVLAVRYGAIAGTRTKLRLKRSRIYTDNAKNTDFRYSYLRYVVHLYMWYNYMWYSFEDEYGVRLLVWMMQTGRIDEL